MKTAIKYRIWFLVWIALPASSNAQDELVPTPDPFIMVPQPRYSLEEGEKFNSSEYYSHPDFGILPFTAPHGRQVVEDISKRTLDERYYVDIHDNTFFYIEKSSAPINFYQNDILRAIDPSLHRVSEFYYESGPQPVPVAIDLQNHQVILKIGNDHVGFSNVRLETIDSNDVLSTIDADWSNVIVGNFGAHVVDIFPDIDLKIVVRQGGFKTTFVIKQNLGFKEIRFVDAMSLPDKYSLVMEGNEITSLYVQLQNSETGETDVVIDPARTSDASGNRISWLNSYQIDNNELRIICDSLLLNGADKIYPLSVDPLFTAVGPIASAFGIRGSLLTPSSCNNSLNVTFPGGSTPWDVSATWQVYTDFCARTLILFGFYDDCYMSDAQVWITSSCGGASPVGAPGTIWTCLGCNSIGTWTPTLPFASSGTQSLAQCYGTSCSNQTLTFTMFDNRTYCTSYTVYDNCNWANSYCVSLDQWSVTVQGRTIETLGNTVTGNGSQTINDPDCIGTVTLDPTPLYGVPGYTYNWSTGSTAATINVGVTPAIYTCTVTDLCGNAVVATFNIGCPLPVRFESFDAVLNQHKADLTWVTSSESDLDYFILERASKENNFIKLAAIEAGGSDAGATYTFQDVEPLSGINYYRLVMISENGEKSYSEIVSVLNLQNEITIVPNPNNGTFEIFFDEQTDTDSKIQITNPEGVIVYSDQIIPNQISQKINLEFLPAGIYYVEIFTRGKATTEKLIIR